MSNHEDEEKQHLDILEELEATQALISNYENLLKDLPEIYERKFNERLQPFLVRKQQLLQERELLLDRIHQQLPEEVGGQMRLILPPRSAPQAGPPVSTISRRWRARQFWWWVGCALLGGLIGLQVSHHLGKRSASTSMAPMGGMGDHPRWERQTTTGPTPESPIPARPEKAAG
jgi:hypothetical protein